MNTDVSVSEIMKQVQTAIQISANEEAKALTGTLILFLPAEVKKVNGEEIVTLSPFFQSQDFLEFDTVQIGDRWLGSSVIKNGSDVYLAKGFLFSTNTLDAEAKEKLIKEIEEAKQSILQQIHNIVEFNIDKIKQQPSNFFSSKKLALPEGDIAINISEKCVFITSTERYQFNFIATLKSDNKKLLNRLLSFVSEYFKGQFEYRISSLNTTVNQSFASKFVWVDSCPSTVSVKDMRDFFDGHASYFFKMCDKFVEKKVEKDAVQDIER